MTSPQDRPTTLERVFALARTGRYMRIDAIKLQLQSEGYSVAQVAGPSLLRQIRAICVSAQKRPG